jgi:hypothetical protein
MLPDGPEPVNVAVVEIKDGVKGRVLEGGQGVIIVASDKEVRGVVDHL